MPGPSARFIRSADPVADVKGYGGTDVPLHEQDAQTVFWRELRTFFKIMSA